MSEELRECKYSVLTSLKKTYYKKKTYFNSGIKFVRQYDEFSSHIIGTEVQNFIPCSNAGLIRVITF